MTALSASTSRLARPGVKGTARSMTAWDSAAIGLLGLAGFAFSYDALRQVALAIHARPGLSYLFPLFVDGFIAYGVRALVLLRNREFGARLYSWGVFLLATGASIWANVLHSVTLNAMPPAGPSALRLGDQVVGVLSTLAPLALAGSVHLYIVMARTVEATVGDRSADGPGPVRDRSPVPDREGPSGPSANASTPRPTANSSPFPSGPSTGDGPGQGGNGPGATRGAPTTPPHEHKPDTEAGDVVPGTTGLSGTEQPNLPEGSEPGPRPAEESTVATSENGDDTDLQDKAAGSVPDQSGEAQDRRAVDPALRELLPLARDAARSAGRISRSAVQEAVRAQQPISNDRLGDLLDLLREEEGMPMGGRRLGRRVACSGDRNS